MLTSMSMGIPIENSRESNLKKPRFKDRDDCRKRVRAAMLTIHYNLKESDIDLIMSESEGILLTIGCEGYVAHVNDACRTKSRIKESMESE